MALLSCKLETRIRRSATECYLPVLAASNTGKRGITERCKRHGKVPHIPSVFAECMVLLHGVHLKNQYSTIDYWSEKRFAFWREVRTRRQVQDEVVRFGE